MTAPEKRLKNIVSFSKKTTSFPSDAFCSFEELRMINNSVLIQIASHSVHHLPLIQPHVCPETELITSKKVLEAHLQTPIHTFVYPYGIFNSRVHTLAKKHYLYTMRIGNALNYSWTNGNGLFYRVSADQLPHPPLPPFPQ